MADVLANSMTCHSRATCHIAECCHLAYSMSWSQSYVSHYRVLPFGEFNGMSSQSHVSHCMVLPLGEFTVMIAEPHATLQGAATWRIQWHAIPEPRVSLQGIGLLPLGEFIVMIPGPRTTLQGISILSAILKIVFRHICRLSVAAFSLLYWLFWTPSGISPANRSRSGPKSVHMHRSRNLGLDRLSGGEMGAQKCPRRRSFL